jgi:hypothetical protein
MLAIPASKNPALFSRSKTLLTDMGQAGIKLPLIAATIAAG